MVVSVKVWFIFYKTLISRQTFISSQYIYHHDLTTQRVKNEEFAFCQIALDYTYRANESFAFGSTPFHLYLVVLYLPIKISTARVTKTEF